jgi:hypothetical protein
MNGHCGLNGYEANGDYVLLHLVGQAIRHIAHIERAWAA